MQICTKCAASGRATLGTQVAVMRLRDGQSECARNYVSKCWQKKRVSVVKDNTALRMVL